MNILEKDFLDINNIYNNLPIPLSINKIVFNKSKNSYDFIFFMVNKEFEQLFKLKREDINGKYLNEIFIDFDNEIFNKFLSAAINGKSLSFKFYSNILKKNFNAFVFSPKKYYFVILFENIDILQEKEAKVIELLNLQSIIREINHLIISTKNEKEFLKKTCSKITKINGIVCSLISLKGENYKIVPISYCGVLSKYLKTIKAKQGNSEFYLEPTVKAIMENKNIIINDINLNKYFHPIKKMVSLSNIKSIASFPLKYEKEVIGALTVYSNIENYFIEDIIDVLVEISCNISIGIRKFIDKEKIMDKTKELEKTIDNMLSSFLKIVSLKEPYTGDHSIRVSNLVLLIGKEMRLSEDRLIALKYASFLHDLGKIFVPSEILNKYGKLTSNEFNLVKEHVLKSFEIVKDINFPYPTHEIILQHHERVDGSGYPNGLKGNEILLEGKILAVADVVDAMLSDRPYRAKLNFKDVIDELNKNKDVKYDKKVVEATLKVLKSLNQSVSENSN